MSAPSQLSLLPLLPGKIYPVKSGIIIHHRLQITCCKSCNQRDNGRRAEPIAVEDYCSETYCWLPPASCRFLMWNCIFSFLCAPSIALLPLVFILAKRNRNMSPTIVPSFQNLHFFDVTDYFVFFNTIPLLVFVSLISSPNPLSLLLARIYPLWLLPPPPAAFDCICFFFILSFLYLSPRPLLSLPLSLSRCVCVIPHSSSSVCLSSSVLLLYLLCSFLFISWHFSQVRRNSSLFLLTSVSAFVPLPLPIVSFPPFLIFLFQPRANEY